MKTIDHLQTISLTYEEICQGEKPWIALGNFMNDWFDYAKDKRSELVVAPLTLPEKATAEQHRWAVFCAASVEWLCQRYNVPCPLWVHDPIFYLPEPWFDSAGAERPDVRQRLIRQTPEPFTRRNIFCGNRMFDNKYEFMERYRRLSSATL